MWLYDDALSQVAYDDDGGIDYYPCITTTLSSGTYYVRANCFLSNAILSSYEIVLTGAPPDFSQALAVGWNLVSIPRIPATPAIDAYLASIEGLYDSVMSYENATQTWLSYNPAAPEPSNTLTTLDESTPFWINLLAPATLIVGGEIPTHTEQPLAPGWNLIAYPAQDARQISIALDSIADHYASVYTFSPETESAWLRYNADRPPWTNSLTTLSPGTAYWVEVNEACTLMIDD